MDSARGLQALSNPLPGPHNRFWRSPNEQL
jgi:hypothetical protein